MRDNPYFEEASSWAMDARADAGRSRRIAWIVAGIAVTVAALEAVALASLAPLKTVQTITLLVDRQTGYVQALDPLSPRRVTADAALTQSYLAQYVTAREGFDRATTAVDYRKVALWSADRARTTYLSMMPATNPDSPLVRYANGTVVTARVKSVSRLDQGVALVRFDTQASGRTGQVAPSQPWISVVRYRFNDAPMRLEDRLVNPLGFQVTSYRRDAEASAPTPAPVAIASKAAAVLASPAFPNPPVGSRAENAGTGSAPVRGTPIRRVDPRPRASEYVVGSTREVPLNQLPMGSPLAGPGPAS